MLSISLIYIPFLCLCGEYRILTELLAHLIFDGMELSEDLRLCFINWKFSLCHQALQGFLTYTLHGTDDWWKLSVALRSFSFKIYFGDISSHQQQVLNLSALSWSSIILESLLAQHLTTAFASQNHGPTAQRRFKGCFEFFDALLFAENRFQSHLLVEQLLVLAEEGEMLKNRICFRLITHNKDAIRAYGAVLTLPHEGVACFTALSLNLIYDHLVNCN